MDGACSTFGEDENYAYTFSRKIWREETIWDMRRLEDNIQKYLQYLDWIHLAQDKMQLRALVNTMHTSRSQVSSP
jgi:hypothetical protein